MDVQPQNTTPSPSVLGARRKTGKIALQMKISQPCMGMYMKLHNGEYGVVSDNRVNVFHSVVY